MLRGVLLTGLFAALALALVFVWSRLGAVEERLALRERQLANHQAVLDAIAKTGKIRESDLGPLLSGQRTTFAEGHAWSVDQPGRGADTTDFPDVSLEFSHDGRLTGVFAYKP